MRRHWRRRPLHIDVLQLRDPSLSRDSFRLGNVFRKCTARQRLAHTSTPEMSLPQPRFGEEKRRRSKLSHPFSWERHSASLLGALMPYHPGSAGTPRTTGGAAFQGKYVEAESTHVRPNGEASQKLGVRLPCAECTLQASPLRPGHGRRPRVRNSPPSNEQIRVDTRS